MSRSFKPLCSVQDFKQTRVLLTYSLAEIRITSVEHASIMVSLNNQVLPSPPSSCMVTSQSHLSGDVELVMLNIIVLNWR